MAPDVGADGLHGLGLLLVDGGHPSPASTDLGKGQSPDALADDLSQPGTELPPKVVGMAVGVGACQHQFLVAVVVLAVCLVPDGLVAALEEDRPQPAGDGPGLTGRRIDMGENLGHGLTDQLRAEAVPGREGYREPLRRGQLTKERCTHVGPQALHGLRLGTVLPGTYLDHAPSDGTSEGPVVEQEELLNAAGLAFTLQHVQERRGH